ncbi:hypothetical protein FGO68_gene6771 [Halteria grandinella]|uniref:Uncharacterized protein n=1 Tax=Halteria grandinella TaxID=5974 RepID=A0A8J8SYU5_HALGN|nr:hypothetical protein FGO68_gene6771 [Halteria grandinella]
MGVSQKTVLMLTLLTWHAYGGESLENLGFCLKSSDCASECCVHGIGGDYKAIQFSCVQPTEASGTSFCMNATASLSSVCQSMTVCTIPTAKGNGTLCFPPTSYSIFESVVATGDQVQINDALSYHAYFKTPYDASAPISCYSLASRIYLAAAVFASLFLGALLL